MNPTWHNVARLQIQRVPTNTRTARSDRKKLGVALDGVAPSRETRGLARPPPPPCWVQADFPRDPRTFHEVGYHAV